MKIEEINTLYFDVCNEYIKKFVSKQGYGFDYWLSDEVGGYASFIEQYVFNFHDIIYDLKTKQPKGLIFQWQNDWIEYSTNEKENCKSSSVDINYKSYCMGLRFNMLK